MKRREFITLLGGTVIVRPLAAQAQQPTIPVIGFIRNTTRDDSADLLKAMHQGLRQTGYVEGRNVTVEYRFADNQLNRLPTMAADLVRRQVAVIVTGGDALTLVVPFAAGGPSDVAGRIVAQSLSEKLGQQVVVENPAGAGGTLGSLRVAKAPPDGYQFVIGNSGTHAWSQALYKKPPYNTVTDFAALGLVVEAPRVIITPKNFPANTLPEFIAYVKANQSTVKYGSAGAGSASHVSCILLNAALGVDIVHIPYRGLGPAMQDLIAGRIDYMCDSPSTSRPQIETNNVKAIATTGAKRTSILPVVPTAREQGLDFEVMTWQGLFLPNTLRTRSSATPIRR